MKLGRNDACWCGSGKKYKNCHLQFDERILKIQHAHQWAEAPQRDMIKTPQQIAGIRKAGEINTQVLDAVSAFIKEGVTTEEIDRLVVEKTKELGGVCACLGYEGYPKSVCTSINEVVCHGIPDENRVLKSGDIVNVDCTTIVDGYYGDASRMFLIGDVSEEAKKLVQVTKDCLDEAVALAKPWTTLGDFGYAINKRATEDGYSVVREIGGHGVGVKFHEDPWVPHIGEPGSGTILVPGMTITIEPMINMGEPDVFCDDDDGWTIYTEDGSLSAQWEYTILITEEGNEILSY
jgi:methionyl aminopeptidase